MEHIKFPSIDQFRSVVKRVRESAKYHNVPLPTIVFEGTVKIHGTNAGVVRTKEGVIYAQSRENVILPGQGDNAGFAAFVEVNKDFFHSIFDSIQDSTGCGESTIQLYGEWYGGNIQKGVGVNGIPKRLTIFKARIGDTAESQNWIDNGHLAGAFLEHDLPVGSHLVDLILDYNEYYVSVDFNKPEEAQNEFVRLTEMVEKDCPVARVHKPDAEDGTLVGEGLVWTAIECSEPMINIDQMFFKTKGEKHSVSKVKTLVPVDVEKLASVEEFVERTVTVNRMAQGIDVLKQRGLEINTKNTGEFIKWVIGDVMKEELDTLVASDLTTKDVSSKMATKARNYFLEHLE